VFTGVIGSQTHCMFKDCSAA